MTSSQEQAPKGYLVFQRRDGFGEAAYLALHTHIYAGSKAWRASLATWRAALYGRYIDVVNETLDIPAWVGHTLLCMNEGESIVEHPAVLVARFHALAHRHEDFRVAYAIGGALALRAIADRP